ncbi:hypothetical protein LV164_002328 [Aspergillus fumigatus]|nr:hypothetical protein KXW18_003636 [Aspergillus fumigatus]KAJ8212554.1 hypothetical protein LV164_002328 [Aspergillus fumigatus]
MATLKSRNIILLLTSLLSLLHLATSQRTPNENLVLADCGIGLGVNGGSTSREMIYYPGDVWTGNGADTNKPTMMVNVPWSGSYPWGQNGGVSARMPNGDVFTVHINPKIKDPIAAGDAWHMYEMNLPLKCYSYHKDKVYQLDDGKWCSSAYVCNHRGTPTPHVKPSPAPNPGPVPVTPSPPSGGFLSGPQEWTYLINPQLMNVREPLNIDDEGIRGRAVATPSPKSEPTQMSFTLQRLNLAVVCREIVDMTAYEHMHGIDVSYDKILELDRKLHQAYNNLPEFYRLDTVSRRRFAALYRSRPTIAWQRCLLQQAYHSRFCRLHRLYFIRGAREPAYSYSHVICLQSARKVLEIKRIMDEDEPKFMPPTSTVWSVMHHVFMAAVILLMDVCFNWDDLLADKRKQEVLDACRMLSEAQRTSSLVSQGIQAMMDVLQKHWKSGKHSSADGQPSNLPSSPALAPAAVAEPAQIVSNHDSANMNDKKDDPSAETSFHFDQNEGQERPLEEIWTEMLDSGGDLNFATPDWTDLLTDLTNATLPCN